MAKLVGLLLAVVVLVALATEQACRAENVEVDLPPGTLEKIKSGFESGKKLVDSVKKSDFVTTVTKTAKWGVPLLKSVGFFAKVFQGFFKSESKELTYMKDQFSIINKKMDTLEQEFHVIKRMIDWNSVKVSFGDYERSINVLAEELMTVFEAPEGARKMMIDQFILKYERDFREATNKLYDSIVNKNAIFSDNLVVAVRKYTKDHQRQVQKFLMGLIQLLLKGAEIEMSYLSFKDQNNAVEFWSGVWEKRLKNVEETYKAVDAAIVKRWHDQAEVDIEDFNAVNHGMSNEQYSGALYEMLMDKFPSRQWFVLIYNPLSGGNPHFVYTCGGFIRFRSRGKNIVIGSADINASSFNSATATKLLNSVSSVIRLQKNKGMAQLLLDNILSKTGRNCSPYAMVGVVEWGGGVWYVGPPSRKAYRKYDGLFILGGMHRIPRTYNLMIFG